MDQYVLAQLQNEYGDIYIVEIGGKEIAYRALTLKEVSVFQNLAESTADLEDIYVQNAVVYPPDFDFNRMKAGHVTQLAEGIGAISGNDISYIFETLEEARRNAEEDVLIKMKAMIIAAMPTHTDDYLDSLTMKQLLQKLVLSEEILTFKQVIDRMQSIGVKLELTPQEEVAEQPQPRKKSPPPKVDKETLLRRIGQENRETINPALAVDPASSLSELDESILVRAAGYVDEDDPIARKLRQAMGGG